MFLLRSEWVSGKRGIMPYIIIILENVKYITVIKLICLLNEGTKESVLFWGGFFLQLTEYFEQMACSFLHPVHEIIHYDTDTLYLQSHHRIL